jgi:hypothetical protein
LNLFLLQLLLHLNTHFLFTNAVVLASGHNVFHDLNLIALQLQKLVKLVSESHVVHLGVTKITDTQLLRAVLGKQPFVGRTGAANSESALLATEITISYTKQSSQRKLDLADSAGFGFRSLLSISVPDIGQTILFVKILFLLLLTFFFRNSFAFLALIFKLVSVKITVQGANEGLLWCNSFFCCLHLDEIHGSDLGSHLIITICTHFLIYKLFGLLILSQVF